MRLAYFGIGSMAVRARRAEAELAAGTPDASRLADAAVAALDHDLDPAEDVQATAAARRHLAGVLKRRVVGQLLEPR